MDTSYQPVYQPIATTETPNEKSAPRASVQSFFSRKSSGGRQCTTQSKPRSRSWHILSHIVSLLWLAPIIALLVLNFEGHKIGASAWCPFGHCGSDVGGDDAVERAAKLDKNDHNLLGALQFVSKALEVWFFMIASALVYDLAMIFARMEGGLPVGYLLTHLEFGDVRNIFNPLLWTSPFPHAGSSHSERHRKRVVRLFLFALLAALLMILGSLMGPGTAVLVLPTLQWRDTPHKASQMYQGISVGEPPKGDNTLFGCNSTDLDAGNYSCTFNMYSSSMDQWVASAAASNVQSQQDFGSVSNTLSQESVVTFMVNASIEDDFIVWVPNRQVLQDVSLDYFQLISTNNSLGFTAQCNVGNVTVTEIDDNREVHCFGNWTSDEVDDYYTKCFRVGTGFNPQNSGASFEIGKNDPYVGAESTTADVFFSDIAQYFNPNDPQSHPDLQRCLSNDTAPSCDWDTIFITPPPSGIPANLAFDNLVLSFSLSNNSNYTTTEPISSFSDRWYCDAVRYLSFPTYVLDTSPTAIVLSLVRLQGTSPHSADPVAIDPDWILAAFSADADPTSSNNMVDSHRPIAQEYSKVLTPAWQEAMSSDGTEDPTSDSSVQEFIFLYLYSFSQALSMVRYTNGSATLSPPTSPAHIKPEDITTTTPHLLRTWSTRHVWAYSVNSSHTSKLGVAVVCLGGLCVLLRLFLGVFLGKREHSPVEMFVAALEHSRTGEFAGMKQRKGS
ncbi:hypothetical protein ACLMJK_002829 [Lecanora helva]